MDFKISMTGRQSVCPKCKNRLLPIRSKNELKVVCTCGFEHFPNRVTNDLKPNQIENR